MGNFYKQDVHFLCSIWNHLVEITKDGNKTVIITTHYIEEARQAHCVSKLRAYLINGFLLFFLFFQIGLMRSGRLLAEASPSTLLSTYNSHSLEDVFLLLSRIENDTRGRPSEIAGYVSVVSMSRTTRSVPCRRTEAIWGCSMQASSRAGSESLGLIWLRTSYLHFTKVAL